MMCHLLFEAGKFCIPLNHFALLGRQHVFPILLVLQKVGAVGFQEVSLPLQLVPSGCELSLQVGRE